MQELKKLINSNILECIIKLDKHGNSYLHLHNNYLSK